MITYNPKELLPVARRHPFSAACVGLSVIFLLVSAVLWKYQASLTKLHRDRQSEGEAVLATLISGPQLRQELALAQEATRRIEKNLTSEDNLDESYTYFLALEGDGETKARIEDFHPLTTTIGETKSSYRRIPFAVKVSGTYPQVAAFLKAVESGPKPASITYFSLRRRATSSTLVVLDMNLDLLGKK